MTSADYPTGAKPSQTALSEAVEQATDAAKQWCDDLTDLVKRECDKIASNRYGLDDLVTAPVSLLQIYVKNAIKAAYVLQDNIALLSYAPPRATPKPKTVRVLARIPENAGIIFASSDMIGQKGYRIRSSKMKILSDPPARGEARDVVVHMEVDDPLAPNDVYTGRLHSADASVSAPVTFVLHEL